MKTHPRQEFLFYIEDDLSAPLVDAMRLAVERLHSRRDWVIAPPVFVDTVDSPANSEIDEPIRTVGGTLELYSALPPWGDQLPKSLDRAHLEEIEIVILTLRKLSEEFDIEIACELDGVQVGWISSGVLSKGLEHGLLGPWRAAISSSGL